MQPGRFDAILGPEFLIGKFGDGLLTRADVVMNRENRSALIEGLWRATSFSQRSRWARALMQPAQAAYPKFLRAIGRSKEVKARTFFGTTMAVVLPESQSSWIWRYGYVDEDVCLFLLASLPAGGCYIDVGAHFGFFTLLGASLVGEAGRVLALEPTPSSYRVLERNTASCTHVDSYPFAAFSEDRHLILYNYGIEFSGFNSAGGTRPAFGRKDPRLSPGSRGPISRTEVKVEARRLDNLITERGLSGVDVIKIDAESAETHILSGLEGTIAACRPALILEVGDYDIEGNVDSRLIVESLEARNYGVFEVESGKIVPHRKQRRYGWRNLLFIDPARIHGYRPFPPPH